MRLLIIVALFSCRPFAIEAEERRGPAECADVLPDSRNTNYTPADPVKGNDLNDIQDLLIELFAEKRVPIPAAAFMSEVVGAKGVFNDGERWIVGADGAVQAIHGLALPVGSVVTHVEFHYRRGSAGNLTGKLSRIATNGATGTSADIASETDAVADSAYHTNDVEINHEIAAGYLYWLRFTGSAAAWGGGAEFIGATLYYKPGTP